MSFYRRVKHIKIVERRVRGVNKRWAFGLITNVIYLVFSSKKHNFSDKANEPH
jgi:hypothetical protein